MMRDDLHRSLTVARHRFLTDEEVDDDDCGLCRNDTAALLGDIVDFVAAWIEQDGVRYDEYSGWIPQARAMRWREDMEP